MSELPGTDELAVAPGPDDVVDGRASVDFDVVDFEIDVVDERVVEVARGADVVVSRGRVVVVVRSVVGEGPLGTIPVDDTEAGRTSR